MPEAIRYRWNEAQRVWQFLPIQGEWRDTVLLQCPQEKESGRAYLERYYRAAMLPVPDFAPDA